MSVVYDYIKTKNINRVTMKSGCRYERAIRQSLNKLLGNRNVINKHIAGIICDYSHTTIIGEHSCLYTRDREFFIIEEMLSPHWCKGYFCPPRLEFVGHRGVAVLPNLYQRTRTHKKLIFDPFGAPVVRRRNKTFHFAHKNDESLQDFPQILI